MHNNNKTVVAVQTEEKEEEVITKWTKREKALTVVMVILIGTLGIVWWHLRILSRNSKALCDSSECIKQAAWMLSSVDPNADPCDNFYDFVCTSKIKLGERLITKDPTTLFEDFSIFAANSSTADLILTKLRYVYSACMNTEQSEMYLKEFFNSLDRWGFLNHEADTFDWRLFLYKARKHGLKYDMLFTFRVVEDGDNAYLRIEPPVVNNAPTEVIRIFNMHFVHDDSFFDETLRWLAIVQEKVVLEMTIEELENNFSIPSLETIHYITGHNFVKNDTIQLKSPNYFEKLKSQLTKDNISQSLYDYLIYELVKPLVHEHQDTFQTWQNKGDSKIEFCVSKATDIVPFTTDLRYKEEALEIVNIAQHILEEFLHIHGNSGHLCGDNLLTVVTLNNILDDYNSFSRLKFYMESQEKHNYMQLVASSQKFKDDCYYSALDGSKNSDLSCVLYNADDIKIHNDSLVIPAKILEHSFYHTDVSTQLNYAGIGTLIGRVLIRELLKTKNDSDINEILQCLFDQQADFYYIPNGAQEQEAEEMYIDVAGTQLAYRTYLSLDSIDFEKVLPGLEYTKTQLFWLTKFRDQCDHSDNFSQASVLPFVNIDNFTADFFCAQGRYVNPTSVPRCSLL